MDLTRNLLTSHALLLVRLSAKAVKKHYRTKSIYHHLVRNPFPIPLLTFLLRLALPPTHHTSTIPIPSPRPSARNSSSTRSQQHSHPQYDGSLSPPSRQTSSSTPHRRRRLVHASHPRFAVEISSVPVIGDRFSHLSFHISFPVFLLCYGGRDAGRTGSRAFKAPLWMASSWKPFHLSNAASARAWSSGVSHFSMASV